MKKKRGVQRGGKGCAGVWRPVAPRHREVRGREVEDSADWRAQGASEKERKKEREGVGWAGTVGWVEQANQGRKERRKRGEKKRKK